MSLPRCPHDVYDPTKTGVSPYCSGCTSPQAKQLPERQHKHYTDVMKQCPVCESRKSFKFRDEWDWHCYECDADALDI